MDPEAELVAQALIEGADADRAEFVSGWFKTGPGEYAEGDRFLGLRLPFVRATVKRHHGISIAGMDELVMNPWHEIRLAGVLLMGEGYRRGDAERRAEIFDLYLARTEYINNWDLVDVSADKVVGPHLDIVGTEILDHLAASELLWDRRIAMIATFYRIKRGESGTALHIAEVLLSDREPLIHKAVGWMLREVGKRVDEHLLTSFLDAHAPNMAAVTLAYATERLTPAQRIAYRELRRRGGSRPGRSA